MKNRNVTLRKIVHARWDIPVIHTPHRYTMVCVDNLKKYFARESQSEPTVRPLVAQSNVGAGSRLIQNLNRTRSASSRDAGERRGECFRLRRIIVPRVKPK